jgi:HEAT repeat protein
MPGESTNQEPGNISSSVQHPEEQEPILAAIALLLGPDTSYQRRQRAAHRLAKVGSETLPLLLRALQAHPEITTPSWPWWPPQYEQLSRLLIQLSQHARLSLEDLLRYSPLPQAPGPVLWTSVIEAAGLLPHMEYEPLLLEALQAPWWTVRYAAAMAIAKRATYTTLCSETHQALHECQYFDSETPVRLVASCALLRCADESGLEALIRFLKPEVSNAFRKAALFILATELPTSLAPEQKRDLAALLFKALQDDDLQIALHAARALRAVATPEDLPELNKLLKSPCPYACLATLTALEELASRKTMRCAIQQQFIPQQIATLLRTQEPEIRRQACYTLATIGGEYTTAVLGTIILNIQHPAHLEAIEALRLLPDVRQPRVLSRIISWLLHSLVQPGEMAQVCALDSLSYLIWHARLQRRHKVLNIIVQEMEQSGVSFQLLASPSSWVRQRTVELFSLLDSQLYNQRATLLEMLHHDIDSGVRACIAYTLGQSTAVWAIPDLLLALLDCDEYVAETALNALGALPLLDDALITCAIKELAAYRLPIPVLQEHPHLTQVARAWLKKRKKHPRSP